MRTLIKYVKALSFSISSEIITEKFKREMVEHLEVAARDFCSADRKIKSRVLYPERADQDFRSEMLFLPGDIKRGASELNSFRTYFNKMLVAHELKKGRNVWQGDPLLLPIKKIRKYISSFNNNTAYKNDGFLGWSYCWIQVSISSFNKTAKKLYLTMQWLMRRKVSVRTVQSGKTQFVDLEDGARIMYEALSQAIQQARDVRDNWKPVEPLKKPARALKNLFQHLGDYVRLLRTGTSFDPSAEDDQQLLEKAVDEVRYLMAVIDEIADELLAQGGGIPLSDYELIKKLDQHIMRIIVRVRLVGGITNAALVAHIRAFPYENTDIEIDFH